MGWRYRRTSSSKASSRPAWALVTSWASSGEATISRLVWSLHPCWKPASRRSCAGSTHPGVGAVPSVPGGRPDPPGEPACQVDPDHRAAVVAGEEAALPLERAAGDDVLVAVARQQADIGGLDVGGQLLVRRGADLRPDPDLQPQPGPVGADGGRHGVELVAADQLPGPRGVVGERLRLPL